MRCVLLVRRVGSLGLSASHGELHPLLPTLPPQGPAAPPGWGGGTLLGQSHPPRLGTHSPITSAALVLGAAVWLCWPQCFLVHVGRAGSYQCTHLEWK